ncbi:hypothetical protein [uncultured Methylobacterium sp.]|uniref:hypothetical protein n=1 Tax=uncultured Methylobacterium sp. TaxID=157278 RepID=UPI0035C9C104
MSDAPVGLARLWDTNREIRPILLRCKLAADYPRAADNKLAAMQRVLSWARDRGITGHRSPAFTRSWRPISLAPATWRAAGS